MRRGVKNAYQKRPDGRRRKLRSSRLRAAIKFRIGRPVCRRGRMPISGELNTSLAMRPGQPCRRYEDENSQYCSDG